jgi:hypothetical protein
VIQALPLETSTAPGGGANGFSAGGSAELPVSVGENGTVYVGFTSGSDAVVLGTDGLVVNLPGANLGGVTATQDGVALLLFDPVDDMWAAAVRFTSAGQEVFATDLFRSPNLDDEGTKGEPGSSRLGYLSGSDQLVLYFGHTQRYDDGVRHQGGYLALVDATGNQELLNGWFGSHNLDQRLWTNADSGAVIGLGDAYPIGIFYSPLGDNPRPEVIYRLAAAGNGAANGQLGGIVDLGSELVMPFITNLSVSPDIDAGEWPDIDDNVASQIREAAANGTDMGLLRVAKGGELGDGDAPTVWLQPDLSADARLERLKSARYGDGELVLLIWAEASGGSRDATRSYYTMVVDADGAICQPKAPLDSSYAPTGGDDIVRGPDGAIYWANAEGDGVSLISLVPQ